MMAWSSVQELGVPLLLFRLKPTLQRYTDRAQDILGITAAETFWFELYAVGFQQAQKTVRGKNSTKLLYRVTEVQRLVLAEVDSNLSVCRGIFLLLSSLSVVLLVL